MSEKTLFERIIDREIPGDIIYEDDVCIAFRDIQPQAPTHLLVVPRKPIPRVSDATKEDATMLGRLLLVSAKVARQEDICDSGFRMVINNGADAFQTVEHIHVHVLGGRKMSWPPG